MTDRAKTKTTMPHATRQEPKPWSDVAASFIAYFSRTKPDVLESSSAPPVRQAPNLGHGGNHRPDHTILGPLPPIHQGQSQYQPFPLPHGLNNTAANLLLDLDARLDPQQLGTWSITPSVLLRYERSLSNPQIESTGTRYGYAVSQKSAFDSHDLMDVTVSLYQILCFPIYGIPKVRRGEYIIIDRQSLSYLNWIEKLNCVYCGYFNGLLGFVREVAARTEQYWCPVRHARTPKSVHTRYRFFLEYGDAQSYRKRLETVRRQFDDLRARKSGQGRRP